MRAELAPQLRRPAPAASNRLRFAPPLGFTAQGNEKTGGDSMHKTNDALWLAFEALAKTYPHDDGVRMTAELSRWLLEQRQRLQLPVPPIIQKVLRAVLNK